MPVGDAIGNAVQAGVGVSHQNEIQVQWLRVHVLHVQDDNQSMRRPAQDKNDEDDKECARQLRGLQTLPLPPDCTRSSTIAFDHGCNLPFAVSDVLIDLVVTDADQDHGESYSDDDKGERVAKVCQPVPKAGEGLGVISIIAPPKEVGRREEGADDPEP